MAVRWLTVPDFFHFFDAATSVAVFYLFTCFTIDTSLLRALLAHHGKAFSGVLGRCGCMIPICRFWVSALSLLGLLSAYAGWSTFSRRHGLGGGHT